ncbi:hypothetical protein K438DRAFT_1788316 [Mycena galopus ATCC 62051]|nr:hypothetical protein K438DRAFT_1788316 [Mycena galopus ATCC 62051]
MDANAGREARTECNQISNEAQFLVNVLPNVETEAVERLHPQLSAIKVVLLDLNHPAGGIPRLVKNSSPQHVFIQYIAHTEILKRKSEIKNQKPKTATVSPTYTPPVLNLWFTPRSLMASNSFILPCFFYVFELNIFNSVKERKS